MTAAAADGRALQLSRAGYGVALLLKPGLTMPPSHAAGRLSQRACRVAWLLGARHLAQATLTALAPRRECSQRARRPTPCMPRRCSCSPWSTAPPAGPP